MANNVEGVDKTSGWFSMGPTFCLNRLPLLKYFTFLDVYN